MSIYRRYASRKQEEHAQSGVDGLERRPGRASAPVGRSVGCLHHDLIVPYLCEYACVSVSNSSAIFVHSNNRIRIGKYYCGYGHKKCHNDNKLLRPLSITCPENFYRPYVEFNYESIRLSHI